MVFALEHPKESQKHGFSVSGAGDVNGDGYDDFIIGAYGDDDGGSRAGQTYLILGRSPPSKVANNLANIFVLSIHIS